MTSRQTKRRYAHELYPHGEEHEIRPLSVEVPYLYARALGLEVSGTNWVNVEPRTVAGDRTWHMIDARHRAFNADALLQGLAGEEAWRWAEQRAMEESGEIVWERAVHYGVDPYAIKPYPCGPERDHHEHLSEADARGNRWVDRVQGKESECEQCTVPVEEASA